MTADPGPIPRFLQRPMPTPEAWERFRADADRRMGILRGCDIVMPTTVYDKQTLEGDMAKGAVAIDTLTPTSEGYVDKAGTVFKSWGDVLRRDGVKPPEPLPDMKDPMPSGRDGAKGKSDDDYPAHPAKTTGRGALTDKGKDAYGDMGKEERLALAKKRGYVEQPAPNGGVATMRVFNFLRNWDKQKAAKK